jgi:protein-tyrosine phosphatase
MNEQEHNKMTEYNISISGTLENQRQPAKRPPPLKIPKRMPIIMEIPEDMIEWHGILLPIEDVVSPLSSPSHWTVRIKNPIIQHIYNLCMATLSIYQKYNLRWTDMQPVEFLPNVYLGSYYDIYNFRHSIRVSILEDFSLLNICSGKPESNIKDKLEIYAKDDSETDIMQHFEKIKNFLDKQSDDEIKFIHCVAGINRSATLATAYYIYKTGRPLIEAIHYMVALRPVILRNENFIKQLIVWAYDNGFVSNEYLLH